MSVSDATVNQNQTSWWDCFPEIGARIRRNPKYARLERNLPVATSVFEAVGKVSQSKELSLIFQGFNGTPGQANGDVLDNPGVISLTGRIRLFIGGLGIITSIAKIISEIKEIFRETFKQRPRERTDAGLRLTEGVAQLGDSIASFGKSLSMTGLVNQAAILNWAPPLAYASAILSTITIPINLRGIEVQKEFIQKLSHESADESLDWLAEEIVNDHKDGDYFLQRHFEIPNHEKYGAQILYIIREGTDIDKADLQKAIKDRAIDKIKSHKLAIQSAVIGMFATVLLFFPALGPILVAVGAAALVVLLACYGQNKWAVVAGVISVLAVAALFFPVVGAPLLGLGTAIFAGTISVYKFIQDQLSVRRLECEINRIRPFHDIPRQWVEREAHFAHPCLDPLDHKVYVELPRLAPVQLQVSTVQPNRIK